MSTTFRFLGISAFLITTATGKKILIDPFLNENDTNPFTAGNFDRIDLIIVSHAAYDPSETRPEIAKIPTICPVICGNDSKLLLLERGSGSIPNH
jgi:L-ascorbate metabolism protein UlaG (beta-lactamase superfamily)